MKKKMRVMLCTMMAAIWVLAMAMPAMAAPKVKEAEYEGNGRVEVEFGSKVNYKNVKVTVKDGSGKSYTTKIVEKDSDDLTFVIKNFAKGKTYTYTISGIKKRSEKSYGSLKGTVKIPGASAKPRVKEVDYDRDDKEVEFEFANRVQWKSPKVTISDGKKNYVVRIREKDSDGIEVKVNKLTIGKTYKYTITGVRIKGNASYTTITGSFKARKD